jgi:hypothetical protein
MRGVLVVVPCGQGKVWDRAPQLGPVAARDAYTGAPFKVNRAFAERFGARWVVLSAKYGFVSPDFMIPGPYNVTFKRQSTNPVEVPVLRRQISEQDIDRFDAVIGLGGKEYQEATREAFSGLPPRLHFPFAGLPLGKAMQATKQAVSLGELSFL